MIKFPLFHGIRLAVSGFIENFKVERLATDPTELDAGRAWYNTTEKVWKQTSLDASGTVVVRSFATVEALNAAIDSQKAYVDGKIADLGKVFNLVGPLTGGATAEAAFDMSTLSEKDAGDYYTVEAGGYFVAGGGTPFYANKKDGLSFGFSGDVIVHDNSNSEMTGTADEIEVSGSTDTGFTAALSETFKNRVATLESAQAAADASKFTFESSTPALLHTVNHGLNSPFLAVEVWMFRDGAWRNDYASVALSSDNNSVTVELAEAQNVRVTIANLAA